MPVPPPQRFGFLLVPPFGLAALACAVDALLAANAVLEREAYAPVLLVPQGTALAGSAARFIGAPVPLAEAGVFDGLIVVADAMPPEPDPHAAAVDAALAHLAAAGAWLGGIGTGSAWLARAGCLRGHRCTAHWTHVAELATRHPEVIVSGNVYEIDRRRLSCAGGSTSLELMIAWLGRMHGERFAQSLASHFGLERVRAADERQQATRAGRVAGSAKLAEAIALMEANVAEPLNTDDVARLVGVSRRQLERLFKQHLDALPSRWYLDLRLDHARRLLQQSSQSILQVGLSCGFTSAPHFSNAYRSRFGRTPRDERSARGCLARSAAAGRAHLRRGLPMKDSVRFRFRAARPDDLDVLAHFAAASADGITTLPEDRDALAARLARSCHAFATDDAPTGEEIYLFVVEDLERGRVVGTSGIAASAGHGERFYTFRNEIIGHSSPVLGASNRVHALQLCHDLTGVTLLTSFYVEPEYAHGPAPQLLSRARLLFIAQFADRFAERIAAESPGLADDAGRCPFWDAVGRRFFDMDYPSIERLAVGRSRSFIAALMPPFPVYVSLLPEQAQWAIGQLHPVGELPFSILIDEGFDPDSYVDIFDGGPIVLARAALLKTVARSGLARLEASVDPASSPATGAMAATLVATTRRDDFRAVLVAADGSDEARAHDAAASRAACPPWACEALGSAPGSTVRCAPLERATGEQP